MKIYSLSGWGTVPHTFSALFPSIPAEFQALNYRQNADYTFFSAEVAQLPKPDVVIGWSLGGQLAARLVADGLLKPDLLILIGAPYAYLSAQEASAENHQAFLSEFEKNPKSMMDRLLGMILHSGKRPSAAMLMKHLSAIDWNPLHVGDWLRWLKILAAFNSDTLNFSAFPSTLLIHGLDDAVIPFSEMQQFKNRIPHAEMLTLESCGHAPHWQYPELVAAAIDSMLKKTHL